MEELLQAILHLNDEQKSLTLILPNLNLEKRTIHIIFFLAWSNKFAICSGYFIISAI